MSRFAVVVLCAMAFLVQAVLSQQCGCSCGSSGISLGGISLKSSGISGGSISSKSYSSSGSYGGAGTGRVGVIGDIDACGNTCVEGSVPVLGEVCFGGCVPACGSVSICGQCGCGCKN